MREANGGPGAGFYRLEENGTATFFALQLLTTADGHIRTIDHFMSASAHGSFFAAGLARTLVGP